MWPFSSSTRKAGDRLLHATPWLSQNSSAATQAIPVVDGSGNAQPWAANLAGIASSQPVDTKGNASPWAAGALPDLLPTVATAAAPSIGGREALTNAGQFLAKNRGAILKGGGALGALGILAGAAGELNNPDESRLSNVAGALGSGVGGLGGMATGAAIGSAIAPGVGTLIGGAIGGLAGGGALSGIARAGASMYEGPNAAEDRRRAMERRNAIADLEARLPIEMEYASAKAAIENQIAQRNAAIQSQQMLQQAMAQGIMDRTRIQGQQNLALTQALQGVMQNI
jgi:hypothetical protein